MATDVGRVSAARNGIKAVEFSGAEVGQALSALDALELAIVENRLNSRWEARPAHLHSLADYVDAPQGTRVRSKFGDGHWMLDGKYWAMECREGGWVGQSPNNMAGTSREVVKWGDL